MPDTNLSPQVSGPCLFWGIISLLLSLTGCSNGEVITKRYELPRNLQTLTVYNNLDVQLVQDTEYYAEVQAGEKVADAIKLDVEGSHLTLRNTSSYNWTRSYDTPRRITLHLPRISNVFQRGYGLLSSAGEFRQDTMFLHLVGAGNIDLTLNGTYLNTDMFELGDMTLRGQLEELVLEVGGNGRLFADGLQTRRCFFRTTRDSNGDAYVRATDAVIGTVAGKGTFYYSGNPPNTGIQVTGKGRVVRR